MSETQVAEVTATPTGETDVTATEQVTAAAATPEGAAADGAATAAEAATEERPQPAWATVTDPYDLFDVPEIKEIKERDDLRLAEELRSQYEQDFQAKHQSWEATNAHQTLQSIFGRLKQAAEELDQDLFGKQLARLQELAEPFTEKAAQAFRREGEDAGYTKAAQTYAAEIHAHFTKGMDRRNRDQFDDLWKQASQGKATWADLFEFRETARVEREAAPLRTELEGAKKEIERLKLLMREGKGLPPEGDTPASTRDEAAEDKLLLDPSTPINTIQEIMARRSKAS